MNKKIILLIVLSLVLAGGTGMSGLQTRHASAAPLFQKVNFTTGVVSANTLNVRQGPGTNFPVVCKLKKGQSVNIFGKIGDWYAIYEPGSSCVGVAASQYIKVQGTAQQTPAPAKSPAKAPANTPQKSTDVQKSTPKPAASQQPAQTTKVNTPSGVTQEEQALLELVNKARADAGVGPLQFDMELMKVARLKAKDMVENNYFSHQSPTYGSPFDMMRQFGISFKTAGENIAGNSTVEGAFKAWMNSEGHKKNILNGNFNYTGIGIVDSPRYGKMFAHMFIGK